jgi:hypothetical protein
LKFLSKTVKNAQFRPILSKFYANLPNPCGFERTTRIAGSFPRCPDTCPQGADSYPYSADNYPCGSDSYPYGSDMYPCGLDMCPQGSDNYPYSADSYPYNADMCPHGADNYTLITDTSTEGSDPSQSCSGLYSESLYSYLSCLYEQTDMTDTKKILRGC